MKNWNKIFSKYENEVEIKIEMIIHFNFLPDEGEELQKFVRNNILESN